MKNIRNGQVFDENFLMSIATIGAFGCGEYPEAVAVMLFYQVGELFQSVAVGRSRQSIAALMDIRPDYANMERDGQLVQVDPDEVAVGDTIVIKAGERVPLDGIVTQGNSALDTAALTGESLPRDVAAGDEVISGCVNLSGLLHVRVTRPFGESTVAKILDLVENSSEKKAKAEHFITKFARYYTPAVVFAALALAVIPSPLGAGEWLMWVQRALIFLVVSCPCALVISIPLSFFGGIGGASRQGILVKGGNYLEALARAGIVVFDKTGTLTRGTFEVTVIHPPQLSDQELLELAALAEHFSTHPISLSIQAACRPAPDPARVTDVKEIAGRGVQAVVDGRTVLAGNQKLMDQFQISFEDRCRHMGTIIHVAVDGEYAGHIVISDQPKPEAAQALSDLKAAGVRRTVMLTGDAQSAAEGVARELGLDEFHAELLPGDKVDQVERLLAQKQPKENLVFVGDGINDAPVLSRADIGVAMGALGSDAAIEAAVRSGLCGHVVGRLRRRGRLGPGHPQRQPDAAGKMTKRLKDQVPPRGRHLVFSRLRLILVPVDGHQPPEKIVVLGVQHGPQGDRVADEQISPPGLDLGIGGLEHGSAKLCHPGAHILLGQPPGLPQFPQVPADAEVLYQLCHNRSFQIIAIAIFSITENAMAQ